MFDRFTDKAKKSMNLARMAAQEFGHPFLAPEHILHGVLSAGENRAWQLLAAHKVVVAEMLADLRGRMPPAEKSAIEHLPFTVKAKRVLEQAMLAAQEAGHTWIGTEHLLVGLSECTADTVADLFHDRGLRTKSLQEALCASGAAPEGKPIDSPETVRALQTAMHLAKQLGDEETVRRLEALIARLPYIRRRTD